MSRDIVSPSRLDGVMSRAEGVSTMRCTRCGTELLPGKKFCVACGASALAPCANCGAQLEPDWRFCPDCGRGQGAAVVPAPEAVAPAHGRTLLAIGLAGYRLMPRGDG
jgi:RNA polymerase subunit RPABC4/transcription elongation factor Spt4